MPPNRVWFVGNQEPEMNEFCLQECQDHARTLTLTLDCPTPPPPSPPGSLPPVACYTHHFFVCLLVCFLLFSNQWQKNPLFNAKHPFSFRSKMPEKTGSALDPAGSTRRSLLFDRERSWPLSSLYLWICCSCCPRLWLRCWLSEAIRR